MDILGYKIAIFIAIVLIAVLVMIVVYIRGENKAIKDELMRMDKICGKQHKQMQQYQNIEKKLNEGYILTKPTREKETENRLK